jgi:hypothetical protein
LYLCCSDVIICVVRLLFVLFYVVFVCKCVLPPGDNPTAVNKCIISHNDFIRLRNEMQFTGNDLPTLVSARKQPVSKSSPQIRNQHLLPKDLPFHWTV